MKTSALEIRRAPSPCRTLVVGLGVSGKAVCELLLQQGCRVVGTDVKPRESFEGGLDLLEARGCRFRLGGHPEEGFADFDRIVVSPGVPLDTPFLREAARRGVEIVGEMEWAWRQVDVPVVAVTGTNGKTTATTLLGEMLRQGGKRVFVGGNIGTPLSRWLLDGEAADVLVLEVSSFQLDTATSFKPRVGVLLNVTEDHLDRYASGLRTVRETGEPATPWERYVESKFSLFARYEKGGSETAVLNGDDALCRTRLEDMGGTALVFSREDPGAHAVLSRGGVRVRVPGKPAFSLSLERCSLKGAHNEENVLAAALAATVFGAEPRSLQEALDKVVPLPHRVEWVRRWRGVDFYNDSKATNVGAVVKALENFRRPVWLLVGGRDKGGSYAPLVEAFKGRGRKALVFGEASRRLYEAFRGAGEPAERYDGLEAALGGAVGEAMPGDVVLLSPACSSFDQYESYGRRGEHFRELVHGLP